MSDPQLNSSLDLPLDPVFRDALRKELVRTVDTTPAPRPPRRWTQRWTRRRTRRWTRRRTLTLSAVLLVGLGGGGAAVATGALPLPGADQVVLHGPASTVVHTGPATVDLGDRPAGTTSVELVLTCLSPGGFSFADGAGMTCSAEDVAREGGAGGAGYTLALKPGQTSTQITAAAGTRWSLTSTYSTHTPTDWATNANGDTYGVTKDCGGQFVVQVDGCEPDLVAVVASNGQQGYAYNTDLNPQPTFTSPADALAWQKSNPPAAHTIPVYTSDGVTVIGEFQTG
ncbi:hypothetical protein OG218_02095 [Kineococcus sp. NBC_00420]|uniref:hypothetical protein n=1 Tax=Kineococcus sp. NBC_00420 TaxID=2903564 RepID=UPI002E1A46DC